MKLFFIGFVMLSLTTFSPKRGQVIDRFNGVEVYYNGKNFTNVSGRSVTEEGYNLGLKYQCVEFIKRYYYERFDHIMPYSYGHAFEFFNKSLPDKGYNEKRGLMQFRNIRHEKPMVEDIIVYNSTNANPFGHMGIVTRVTNNKIEFIQQNFGTKSRQTLKLVEFQGIYTIADYDILGWLRIVK